MGNTTKVILGSLAVAGIGFLLHKLYQKHKEEQEFLNTPIDPTEEDMKKLDSIWEISEKAVPVIPKVLKLIK